MPLKVFSYNSGKKIYKMSKKPACYNSFFAPWRYHDSKKSLIRQLSISLFPYLKMAKDVNRNFSWATPTLKTPYNLFEKWLRLSNKRSCNFQTVKWQNQYFSAWPLPKDMKWSHKYLSSGRMGICLWKVSRQLSKQQKRLTDGFFINQYWWEERTPTCLHCRWSEFDLPTIIPHPLVYIITWIKEGQICLATAPIRSDKLANWSYSKHWVIRYRTLQMELLIQHLTNW